MASSTCRRVASSTPGFPVDTRETVCDDTPASRATSAIETPRDRRWWAASVIFDDSLTIAARGETITAMFT